VDELRVRVGNLVRRHLAERATQLAEAKYHGIISTSADAIVAIDAKHEIIEWNDGAEKIFGYRRAEVLGQPLAMLLPERYRNTHHGHIVHFAREPQSARKMTHSTAVGRRKTGEEFPIAATISRFEVGGHALMTAAIRDVHEEKRTEDELRTLADFGAALASLDYEKTLQELVRVPVRSLGDFAMLFLFDNHDRLQTVATASRDPAKAHFIESLMGVPFEPNPAIPMWKIITTRRSTILNVAPEAYESLASTPERLEIMQAIKPRSVVAVPLLFSERFLGVLALASASRNYDARDLRIVEEVGRQCTLFIENARLHNAKRTAIRARDDVLGVVAHDLRNPLGVILLEATMLGKLRSPSEERLKRFAENIDRSARRMGRIIDDLLDVVHIESGHLSMDRNHHSPSRIIADAVETQKSLASRTSLELRSDVAPNLPELYVDRDRILQVLENLLGNAIKFSQAGQTIVVGAKQAESDVLVWVQDQGVGIAPDALPRVFDRFWRGDVRNGGGTGLGLAIVKGIVESHGGRVWVESTLGAGSTFYFTIPVVRRDAPPKLS